MNILIYANCQGGGVKKIIDSFKSTKLRISLHHEINYMTLALDSKGRAVDLSPEFSENISKADIIIYQPLSRKYGFFSTENDVDGSVMTRCRRSCVSISFPYIYNNALWPFIIEGGKVKLPSSILNEIRKAESEKDILEKYDNGSLGFEFFNRFEETMRILEDRERECDVKISNYIRNNLTKNRLFLTQNHPTTNIFSEVSSKIMEVMYDIEGFCFNKEEFMREISSLPENAAELPGYYLIDDYALRHYEFSYMERPDHGAADYYKYVILKAFQFINKDSSIK